MFVAENSDLFLTLGVGIAAIALAVLSIVRARQIVQQQRQILKGQDLEIAFGKKALDEHSLTTVTDTDGVIIDVNKKFLDALGYDRAAVIGRPFREFYVDEDVALSEEIRRGTPDGGIWSGETRLKRADGAVAITQTTVVPLIDDKGEHVKNLSMRVDVTAYRTLENEKIVTSAFDKMLDAVIVHDPDNASIVYMNHFALAEHGWTAEEAKTKMIWDTHYVPDRDKMAGLFKKILSNSKCTMMLENPEQNRTHEARSYAIGVQGGKPRVLTIFRDMTQNAIMERERNRLVSVITHELRTPLTSIKGSLGLLDAGSFGPMSAEAKSMVGMALRNSDRMLELIRGILDAERADQAGKDTPFEPVNLSDLVDDAIQSNLGYGAQFGIQFANPGTTSNLWIKGNESELSQILANLMSNAAKFSPDGASVEVWVSQEGQAAVLNVRDFGSGIPDELQPKLFDRFTQAKQHEPKNVHSSGLGLSIVKTLVEKHGGSIDYQTNPEQGTCFQVRFPLLATQLRGVESSMAATA